MAQLGSRFAEKQFLGNQLASNGLTGSCSPGPAAYDPVNVHENEAPAYSMARREKVLVKRCALPSRAGHFRLATLGWRRSQWDREGHTGMARGTEEQFDEDGRRVRSPRAQLSWELLYAVAPPTSHARAAMHAVGTSSVPPQLLTWGGVEFDTKRGGRGEEG